MSFLLDLIFAALNGTIVNLLTALLGLPLTLLTEFLLSLLSGGA